LCEVDVDGFPESCISRAGGCLAVRRDDCNDGNWDLLDTSGLQVVNVCANAMPQYSNAAAPVRVDLESMAPKCKFCGQSEREKGLGGLLDRGYHTLSRILGRTR
jgi:hypothetical protein